MQNLSVLRFQAPRLLATLCFALSGAALLAGCDANDEADREDFAVFERGDWRVGSFRVNDTDLTRRLRNQYDSEVTFSFFNFEDDDRNRRFNVFGRRSGEAEDLNEDGVLDIDGNDDDLTFFFTDEARPPIRLDYEVVGDGGRIILTSDGDDFDGRYLTDLLLQGSDIGDRTPRIRLVIVR